jgi:histidinol-phosphate phosphatase family protein
MSFAPVRQILFLVGGRGTRLGDLTVHTPKPLLEIAPGLRFLDVLIEEAARHGFNDIILLAGHHGAMVEQAYDGRRVREATISVIREPTPAGTGGALRHASNRLESNFVLANGDSWFDINWRALAADADITSLGQLALRRVPDVSRYGAVELSGERIVRFVEKDSGRGAGLVNAGMYLLDHRILDWITGECSLERDVFPALAANGLLSGRPYDGYFLDIGLPDTFARACSEIPARRRRPAAFFDRDGVLNVDRGYTHRVEDLTWIEDAPAAIKQLNDLGYLVIVVTNQSGVARGFYEERHVAEFHARMQDELAQRGAHVDAFYHCPFHADATVAAYRAASHPDRKPNPGMILRALADWPVERQGSFLIGDSVHDMEAAANAGVPAFRFEGGSLLPLVDQAIAATATIHPLAGTVL